MVEMKYLNRRNAIKVFGLASLATLSPAAGSAFSMNKPSTPSRKLAYNIYGTVEEMKLDSSLKEGGLVRIIGYYTSGDVSKPELIDRVGFIQINKAVHYGHINTDILRYYKNKGINLSAGFIAMLKTHHELEPTNEY